MAILTLFGQQHQLKDRDTPQEQHELLEVISQAQKLAEDIPDLLPKERSYVLLILKALNAARESSVLNTKQLEDLDRLRALCDKIDYHLEESRDVMSLEV